LSKHLYNEREYPTLSKTLKDTMIKSIEPYFSIKGTLREEVCSRLINPTIQALSQLEI